MSGSVTEEVMLSAEALVRRVAELEQTLVAERTVGNSRAKQIETGVEVLRQAVRELQAETRRTRAENARLELDRRHAQSRIAELQTDLSEARRCAAAAAAAAATAISSSNLVVDDDDGDGPQASNGRPAAASDSKVVRRAGDTAEVSPARTVPDAPAKWGTGAPELPTIVGYRVERLLSSDPAARVYEARDLATRRAVHVRILSRVGELLDGKRLNSLFSAKHPGLVSVLSYSVCREGPYLVLERDDGETATQWVKRAGPLPEATVLSVALDVARAMRHAAFHGALHEDLSPDQILVDVTRHVRVRGVGMRGVLASRHAETAAPEYAAPERLRAGAAPDVRSDLYSLGAVLYFLLTGSPPYVGDAARVLRAQESNAPPDVRLKRRDVSEGTAHLVRKLLQSDADLRQQSWDQVLVDLDRQTISRPSTTAGRWKRVRDALAAHPWLLGLPPVALLVLAGWWRFALAADPTTAERFREACAAAEALEAAGDVAGARNLYRPYLTGTGDPAVEREAARRFDAKR